MPIGSKIHDFAFWCGIFTAGLALGADALFLCLTLEGVSVDGTFTICGIVAGSGLLIACVGRFLS